ncbi:hypothetical protein CYY_005148 [Polysphondylium violaceum]|uniref:Ankyrin repeat-containing protein n=1 Tax=Polysphondylium violaceum TaxID=133409 RepID=A0A8J4V737_9MYCE|nr:hypothetical protein CYY_005148 [Polysphondylium violaceum]
MDGVSNKDTTTSLFFQVFKNKYLAKTILDHRFVDDEYLSIGMLFKHNRFDLFDQLWGDNGDGLDINHHDLNAFFRYNSCYQRFVRVWNKFRYFISRDKMERWFQLACKGDKDKNILIKMLDQLYEVMYYDFQPFLLLQNLDVPDSVEILEHFFKCRKKKRGQNIEQQPLLDSLEAISFLAHPNATIRKHMALNLLLVQDQKDILVDKVSLDTLQLLIDNNHGCTFKVTKFPPLDIQKAYFVIKHIDQCTIESWDAINAVKLGDTKILDFLNSKPYTWNTSAWIYSPTIEVFEFILRNFSIGGTKDADPLAQLGNLALVQHIYNNHKSFTFSWKALRSPPEVLRFLLENLKKDQKLPPFQKIFINDQGALFKCDLFNFPAPPALSHQQLMLLLEAYGEDELNFKEDSLLFLSSIANNQPEIVKFLIDHNHVDFNRLSRIPGRVADVFFSAIRHSQIFKLCLTIFKDHKWFKDSFRKVFKGDWALKIWQTIISSPAAYRLEFVQGLKDLDLFPHYVHTTFYQADYYNENPHQPLTTTLVQSMLVDVQFKNLDFLDKLFVYAVKHGNYQLTKLMITVIEHWKAKLGIQQYHIESSFTMLRDRIELVTCQNCVTAIIDYLPPITKYSQPMIATLSPQVLDKLLSEILAQGDFDMHFHLLSKAIEYARFLKKPNIQQLLSNLPADIQQRLT